MKAEFIILTTASAFALAFAYPSAAQIALASVTMLTANRIEQQRKQHKQKALQQKLKH
jgi:hypothetical protein